METLLVVDEGTPFLQYLEAHLNGRYKLAPATSGKQALDRLSSNGVVGILLDLQLPDMSVTTLIQTIHTDIDPYLPVIVVADKVEVEDAVRVMRAGAYDVIPKYVAQDILVEKIRNALRHHGLDLRANKMQSAVVQQHDRMVFASDVMKGVNFEITRLARSNFDILLAGETGVGKDLIAMEIHGRSSRGAKPFVPIAMKSLTETLIESELFGHEKGAFSGAEKTRIGKLEAAQHGTIYVPEVSCLTETVQLKLLQFMQYKTISRVGQDARRPETKLDVRIIMATNESLEGLVKRGKMRDDFYHRISGIRLNVPPLRDRTGDIEPLTRYFVKKHSAGFGDEEFVIDPEIYDAFKLHAWPGNVRELENWVKSALAHSPDRRLSLRDFPQLSETNKTAEEFAPGLTSSDQNLPDYRAAEIDFKRAYFQEALKRASYNVTKAARIAGLTPQGFRKIMNSLVRVP